MLTMPETGGAAPGQYSSVLYFQVESIQSAHAVLAAKGVRFEALPHLVAKLATHDLWMAVFKEPSGNLLAIMGEEKPA